MDLSIIIVNWNSVEYLGKCLKSIYSQTYNLDFEIIVVDNASYDGSDKLLSNEFPEVKFIQSNENIGFARANNLGYKFSSGNYLLFLNPDTELLGPAINIMFSSLGSLPEAGAVGCKLLNSDLSLQTSCIQPFPTILNQAIDIEIFKMRFPKRKFWGIKPLFLNNGKPQEVEVVSGACILVKRIVFEKIKWFSTDYFMYSEDLDLCFKIKRAGYSVYYINGATIIHHCGGSTKSSSNNHYSAIQMRESIFKFIKKSKGNTSAYLYKLSMFFVSIWRLALLSMLLPLVALSGKRKSFFFTFNKWRMILRWSMGMEKWVR